MLTVVVKLPVFVLEAERPLVPKARVREQGVELVSTARRVDDGSLTPTRPRTRIAIEHEDE